MSLIMVVQVAESAQWPKATSYGLRCLDTSHCKDTKQYNGKPAVCRKKVKSNKWVSNYKYCLKELWVGAPCDSSDQCASANCGGGKCKKQQKPVFPGFSVEDAIKILLSDIDKLKEEVKSLKEDTKCNWHGFDQIHIKPRDFFQISGEDKEVHTNYWNKGRAVELHDNYDVLAQYIIPKKCVPTKVAISMNEDCNGFDVYQSSLVAWPFPGVQAYKSAPKVLAENVKFPSGMYDGAFTMVEATIKDYVSCIHTGKSGKWEVTWHSYCAPSVLSIVISDTGGDMCDVNGGYITLDQAEPTPKPGPDLLAQ